MQPKPTLCFCNFYTMDQKSTNWFQMKEPCRVMGEQKELGERLTAGPVRCWQQYVMMRQCSGLLCDCLYVREVERWQRNRTQVTHLGLSQSPRSDFVDELVFGMDVARRCASMVDQAPQTMTYEWGREQLLLGWNSVCLKLKYALVIFFEAQRAIESVAL
jgi:hypothetical protein